MTNKKSTLFLTLLLAIFYFGCKSNAIKNQENHMEKFEWRPKSCAPHLYPTEIVSGDFIFDDESSIYIPAKWAMYNGWGHPGSAHIVGEDFKPVPQQLQITWLSYMERKFYTGKFNLPERKIRQLFEQGYTDDRGMEETFSSLNVGLAPGGIVTLWIFGAGLSLEIEQFKATETPLTMKEFHPDGIDNLDEYIEIVLESPAKNVAEHGTFSSENIPFDKWSDQYRKRYNWTPKFTFTDGGQLKKLLARFYNGEQYFVEHTNPLLSENKTWALPRYYRINWSDKNQNNYGAHIYFDEAETFAAFRQLFDQNKATKAQLNIEIDKYNSNINIFLTNENEKIALTQTRIKVYSMK